MAADGEIVKGGATTAGTVSAMVVNAVRVPDVPVIVIAAEPVVAAQLAARVTTLLLVAGLVPNVAVTPVGKPVAVSVTAPVNPPTSVTTIVPVPLAPGVTESVAGDAASVKLGAAVIINCTVADAVIVPEAPVMVSAEVPGVAELLTVNVIVQVLLFGVPKLAVTPIGRLPGMEQVTLPVNPFKSVIVKVRVTVDPATTESVGDDGVSVKLGGPVTVTKIVVDSEVVPETPVMVATEPPAIAELLAVNVTMLVPVVGLVPNVAVTPVGKPLALSVTAPVKLPMSVITIVSVALEP